MDYNIELMERVAMHTKIDRLLTTTESASTVRYRDSDFAPAVHVAQCCEMMMHDDMVIIQIKLWKAHAHVDPKEDTRLHA